MSPGPGRSTTVPLRVLKTNPTAVPIDRPPDRQTNILILAITRTAFTGPPRTIDLRTNATRGSDKPNQTAREPPHRAHSNNNATIDADVWERMQTSANIDTGAPPDASTNPPIHERNTPNECWCARTPCCPKHPWWSSGGLWPHMSQHPRNWRCKEHRCLSRRNHRQ